MESLKNVKPLKKEALKKIKGGVTINGVQLRAEVKCNKLCSEVLPCNKGCTCAGNRCIQDDIIAVN